MLDEPWLYLDIRDLIEGPHVEAIIDGPYVCPDGTYPEVEDYYGTYNTHRPFQIKEPLTLMSLTKYR